MGVEGALGDAHSFAQAADRPLARAVALGDQAVRTGKPLLPAYLDRWAHDQRRLTCAVPAARGARRPALGPAGSTNVPTWLAGRQPRGRSLPCGRHRLDLR